MMPAKISAIQDDSVSKIVQIEKSLARVGGAPPSDIVFPGLPTHVFTLEFQENSYWVQNTGEQTLYLEESVIPVGNQMIWESGEILQVGKSIKLKLQFEKDPRPTPVGRTLLGIRPTALLTEEEQAERLHQNKLLAMLAVIVVGILFFSSQIILATPDHDRSTRLEFERILTGLDNQKFQLVGHAVNSRSIENEVDDLITALKRARIAELEQREEDASLHYHTIRDRVRKRFLTNSGSFTDPIFYDIHEFVWGRINSQVLP